MRAEPASDYSALPDVELDALVHVRDSRAVAELTRRYNQQLLRTAWSILKSYHDAEEAVQDAYTKAFTTEARFNGVSSYSTWITRIVINEALERRRNAARRARLLAKEGISDLCDPNIQRENAPISYQTPDEVLEHRHLARQLENAVAKLNDTLRPVFVLREVNGLSITETAEVLGLSHAAVKSRHLRARQRLQDILTPEFRPVLDETLNFGGDQCARLTQAILARMFSSTPNAYRNNQETENE